MQEAPVMGYLETEYRLTTDMVSLEVSQNTLDDLLQKLMPGLKRYQDRIGRFLPNGGLVAVPSPDESYPTRMRLTTPECCEPNDLVRYEHAGDHLLMRLVGALRAREPSAGLRAWKTSAGLIPRISSYEHYLYRREVSLKRLVIQLLPFLITIPLLCGSGHLAYPRSVSGEREQHNLDFDLSPRVSQLTNIVRRNNNEAGCLMAVEPNYVGVYGSDVSLSQSCSLLKLGATLIVLKLIVEDALPFSIELDNPQSTLLAVNSDISGQKQLRLASGLLLTPLDIQEEYLNAAKRRFGSTEGAAFERVLALWDQTLAELRIGQPLPHVPDWSRKRQLMERVIQPVAGGWQTLTDCLPVLKKLEPILPTAAALPIGKLIAEVRSYLSLREFNDIERFIGLHQLSWEVLPKAYEAFYRLLRINLQYHELDHDKGLALRMERHNPADVLFDHSALDQALLTPPATRARLRGVFVQHAMASRSPALADWSVLAWLNPPSELILTDPWSEEQLGWEAFLAANAQQEEPSL